MLNLREVDLWRAIKAVPLRMAMTLTTVFMNRVVMGSRTGKKELFNYARLTPLEKKFVLYDDMTEANDSPCKDYFLDVLNKRNGR